MVRKRAVSVIASAVLFALLTVSCLPVALVQMGRSASPVPSPTASRPAPTTTPSLAPSPTPSALPSATPYATPTAEPVPDRVVREGEGRKPLDLDGEGMPEQQRVAETEHFQIYAPAGELPAAVPDLPERAEQILADVSARLGPLGEKREGIRITVRPPSDMTCPPRGLASPRPPRIIIFADDGTSRDQILGVLAHELGHVVIMHRFEDIPSALNEGLATWASAPHFNAWLGNASLDAAVRSYLEDSTYLPLHENYYLTNIYPGEEEGTSEGCITRRETLYIEWASFLDHLIQQEGTEKLERLIETVPDGQRTEDGFIIRPADFEAVYGSSLNQLEAAWLAHLLRQAT